MKKQPLYFGLVALSCATTFSEWWDRASFGDVRRAIERRRREFDG